MSSLRCSLCLLDSFPGVVIGRVQEFREIISVKDIENLLSIVGHILDRMVWSANFIEGGLTISSELVVEGQVRLRMLLELKESSRVVFDIGVAEVVELVTESVADILLKLRAVLREMLIELTSSILKSISCSSCLTLADNLVDTALHIRSSQVLNFKQERHEAHKSLFGVCHEIFVAHYVHRIPGFSSALADENLKELLHLEGLPLDKPIPPFGIVHRKVILRLVTVADSVAESTIGWEHVQRMSYADESLV